MSGTHNADEACPIIEEHKRRNTAKVWFSAEVVRAFKTYDERAPLVDALGDEIKEIPSDYIPYIVLNFQQMTFVCATLWSEEEGVNLMEIDMASQAIQVGEISAPQDKNYQLEDDSCELPMLN
jgi:hypothetical protein